MKFFYDCIVRVAIRINLILFELEFICVGCVVFGVVFCMYEVS